MNITYNVFPGMSKEENKIASEQIKLCKENQKQTFQQIEHDLFHIGTNNKFDTAETLKIHITAYGDGSLIVNAIEIGLYRDDGKKIKSGMMEVFYKLQEGSDDPNSIVKFYEIKRIVRGVQ